jgi:hypothetical protein
MLGGHLISLDQGNLLPNLCMLLDSGNHAWRIGLAAAALQVPGDRAVGVLSNLGGGYDIAVVGALIHRVPVISRLINLSWRMLEDRLNDFPPPSEF